MSHVKSLSLCLLVALACSASVNGQGQDPFTDQDPFSRLGSARRVSKTLDITFEVTREDGSPVAGARIRGEGIFSDLYTQKRGTATLKTDEDLIRRIAARTNGELRYRVTPPSDAVMPETSEVVSLSELLRNKPMKITTRPGIRMTGCVIGQRDRKPVQGVSVVLGPRSGSKDAPRAGAVTDQHGKWSTVMPRVATEITIHGDIEGYKLNNQRNQEDDYSRMVEIPEDVSLIKVSDFEIEQIPPLQILVTDPSGKVIADAQVTAYRQNWLDPQIVMWDEISSSQVTDSKGNCSLYLAESDWEIAMVSATAVVNNMNVEGRASLPPTHNDPIRIVVQPHSEISGVLGRDGKPATNVELILYETTINKQRKWKTIGIRANATTNNHGNFTFKAPVGLHYIVATKGRDEHGMQQVLHRTTNPTTSENYRMPNLNLSSLSEQ